MEAKLVGVHKVKATLANGETVTYFYAWRGGPRIHSKPGTNAFVREFARLTRDRPSPATDQTLGWLTGQYLESAEFQKLKPVTRGEYERMIRVIRARFDRFPLPALEAKGARAVFLSWRDTMRSTPRAADLHMAVLARVFSWAKDRETIGKNPLERVGKLHGETRRDAVWMPSQLKTLIEHGKPHLVDVALIALLTMQRQGDILTMPTLAYDDGRLWIVQGKTGARVCVRPPDDIVPVLERAKADRRQRVLANSFGQPWTKTGFQSSWRKELARLGLVGVRFHDLRGTGITYAYARGIDIERIAEISGHSKAECETIIRKHYLAGADVIEAIRAGTKGA